MIKLLHFADAHIDMANYGRHDPETGLPLRVLDFLRSLDEIIDAAVDEKVDLVIFAGDAYKDRSPAPTFQREWGRRIMRLSRASIPTLLLVGNHDISPALGRAHALDPFSTLEVPFVQVLDTPRFLKPEDLGGLPVQVLALPWISRSGMMARFEIRHSDPALIYQQLEEKISELMGHWLENADPSLPLILTAHASIQGASFGGERTVMLGSDLVLPGSLVRNPKLDYVAMGHIHKPQNLNPDAHPPVIYPGSIERVDFGEAAEEKFYIIANVARGHTEVEWRPLANIRPFMSRYLRIEKQEGVMDTIFKSLPSQERLEGAIVRLILDYPRDWEVLIDDAALRAYTSGAFEFHLVKRPEIGSRVRLPDDHAIGSLPPLELLDLYWKTIHMDEDQHEALQALAAEIIQQDHFPGSDAE